MKSFDILKRGTDDILSLEAQIPESFRDQVSPFIHGLLRNVQKSKIAAGLKDQADYIESKLPKEEKKGF